MTLLNRILLCEVKGLKPEGKYLLARLAQCLGEHGMITLSVKDLAKRFDLSPAHVSDALTTLVAGCVLASKGVVDGRGRPKKQYSFNRRFLKELERGELPALDNEKQSSTVLLHQGIIERVLEHEKRGRTEAPKEREDASQILANVRSRRSLGGLTAVNRLVLAVLLSHADHFGVVDTLGSSALCKATGLSKDRLLHRVWRLVDQGLIRTYVAGAASGIFARKKEANTYFINLGHPDLANPRSQVLTLVCSFAAITADTEFQHSFRLFEEALRRRERPNRQVSDGSNYVQLLQLIQSPQAHIFKRIQLKLEAYAAQLLSTRWSALTDRLGLDDAGLRGQIQNDFGVEKPLGSTANDPANQALMQKPSLLLSQLYRMSRELAIDIKDRLESGRLDLPLAEMDFVIVPQPWEVGYVRYLLLARPRTVCSARGCIIVGTSSDSTGRGRSANLPLVVKAENFASESEIALPDQYRYGLRTQARGVVAAQV